jgi:hypothetical protein
MEPTKSTSRYILTALAIILVITAFVLVGLNALNIEQRLGLSSGVWGTDSAQLEENYRLGYLAAREKYKSMCPMVERQGSSISGTVTSVTSDSLTIEQDFFDTDELVDGVSNLRHAKISANANIQAHTAKDPEILNKELAALKPGSESQPPAPFTVTNIKLSDIKPGDRVVMTSDTELRLAEEFIALTVNLTR